MNLKFEIFMCLVIFDDVDVLIVLFYKIICLKYFEVIGLDVVEGYIVFGVVFKYYIECNVFFWVVELGEELVGVVVIKDNEIYLMMVIVDYY